MYVHEGTCEYDVFLYKGDNVTTTPYNINNTINVALVQCNH